MTPDEYCQEKAARSGSSVYYSLLFLPPEKRRALIALHAFCREVGDVADALQDVGIARAKLAWWRTEVANVFAGNPQHPAGKALLPRVRELALPREPFNEIIDGMEMDLTYHRYPDFPTLQRYCQQAAGAAGRLSAMIFGHTDERTLQHGQQLGIAFQLTHIIRDVGRDARRNRIYLPQDELQRFGVAPGDILAARTSDGFRALMAFQTQRAQDWYRQAAALLPAADRRAQRAGLALAAIYRTLLEEIARDGYAVLNQRIDLTPLRKLWLAWKTWVRV